MNRNNRIVGLTALALVTILAFVILYMNDDKNKAGNNGTTTVTENTATVIEYDEEAIDVAGQADVTAAAKISKDGKDEGFKVTTQAEGYGGPVVVDVYFETDKQTIKHVVVVEHDETRNLGSLIAEDEYTSKFVGVKAPVYIEGMDPASLLPSAAPVEGANEAGALIDGVYEVESARDGQGWLETLTLTVTDGAVTSVVWDSTNEAGEHKSYLSSVGKYVMVAGNPTWKEQADALAASVIANQSTEGILVAENGKTDSVAGVSIAVDGFVALAEDALVLAAGGTVEKAPAGDVEATKLDAVSGATVSSKAMMKAVNKAYAFIAGYAQ